MGENIRIYRERANLTQQELADRVGVTWEMISRYEREESSALKNLEKLSKALNVSKIQLLEKHIPERYSNMEYKVPLFVQIPPLNRFSINQTNYYYSCPEWILQRDRESIAIDATLVECENCEFNKNGILYVSTKIVPHKDDFVILKGSKELIVKKYTNSLTKVLGVVLAQEIRY
jgi:transcriptional regulator with XRE-family HTH domain